MICYSILIYSKGNILCNFIIKLTNGAKENLINKIEKFNFLIIMVAAVEGGAG